MKLLADYDYLELLARAAPVLDAYAVAEPVPDEELQVRAAVFLPKLPEPVEVPVVDYAGLQERAAVFLRTNPFHDSKGRFASGHGGSGGPVAMHDPAVIASTYNYHDTQTGLTTQVESVRPSPGGSTYVDISIKDADGNRVGSASRTIRPADQARVAHSGIFIEPQFQGKGFATRYNRQVEQSYRDHGIQQIDIHASGGGQWNGGYTWAKAGYDFTGSSRGDVAALVTIVHARNYPPAVQAHFARIAADPHASPIDYAMVGWQPGATMWPGKEVMTQVSWDGVKTL